MTQEADAAGGLRDRISLDFAHRTEVQRRQHQTEADAADDGPQHQHRERRRPTDEAHQEERQREQRQSRRHEEVGRDSVGHAPCDRDHDGEHQSGGQQHGAGLGRRKAQRSLHVYGYQVSRTEQSHPIHERDDASHRERP